jgi:hypothetical protein
MPDPAPIVCVSSTYQFFKDFAPSFVTIIAASTAAIITWRFLSRQAKMASFQATLAHDRLRFDLFTERYAIYDAVKQMLQVTDDNAVNRDYDKREVMSFLRIIDEARFFFLPDAAVLFSAISTAVEDYWIAHARWARARAHEDAERAAAAAALTPLAKTLKDYRRNLPALFAKSLSFPTLEGRSPPV